MINFLEYYNNVSNMIYWYLFKNPYYGNKILVNTSKNEPCFIYLGQYFQAKKIMNNIFKIISRGNTSLVKGEIIRIENPEYFNTFICEDDVISNMEEIFDGYNSPSGGKFKPILDIRDDKRRWGSF